MAIRRGFAGVVVGVVALAASVGAAGASGTGWHRVAVPQPEAPKGGAYRDLIAVSCPTPTSCMAVGSDVRRRFGSLSPVAEVRDGTAWRLLTIPQPYSQGSTAVIGVSCASPSSCEVVGATSDQFGNGIPLALAWNGSTWSVQRPIVPAGTQPEFISVDCLSASDCVAVGTSFVDRTFRYVALAERWNGTTWQVLPTADPSRQGAVLQSVACTSPSSCVAAGSAYTRQDETQRPGYVTLRPLIERWSGGAWTASSLPALRQGGDLLGISCPAAGSCVAVGNTTPDGPAPPLQLALVEQGSSWRTEALPATGARTSGLDAVSCSAATTCVAVGSAGPSTARNAPVVEQEGSGGWRVVSTAAPPGNRYAGLYGVACPAPTSCVGVGSWSTRPFDAASTVLAPTDVLVEES